MLFLHTFFQQPAGLPLFKYQTSGQSDILENMSEPNLSGLTLHDSLPPIPDDIENGTDRYIRKLKNYAKSLPYSIESNAKIQDVLDHILLRITQCIEAKDYDPGLTQWDSMLTSCVFSRLELVVKLNSTLAGQCSSIQCLRIKELSWRNCTTICALRLVQFVLPHAQMGLRT